MRQREKTAPPRWYIIACASLLMAAVTAVVFAVICVVSSPPGSPAAAPGWPARPDNLPPPGSNTAALTAEGELDRFMSLAAMKIRSAHFADRDISIPGYGELPGASSQEVMMRVPKETPNSFHLPNSEGYFVIQPPHDLPSPPRRVLLFGASAMFGDRVAFRQTMAHRLEVRLRQQLDDPRLRVLNLARPAWELNSVAMLMRKVISKLQPPPAAVILCTGNNEFWPPPLQKAMKGPPGIDGGYFLSPDWKRIPPQTFRIRIWRPAEWAKDASFWPRLRTLHFKHFSSTLRTLSSWLAAKKIPLLLFSPPINLHLFPGGIFPQPVSFRPLGASRLGQLSRRLDAALQKEDLQAILALVKAEPSGPLQRYYYAQHLDQAGRHQQAAEQYLRARDAMMGPLGALPSLSAFMKSLQRPGVQVLEIQGLYPEGTSIMNRSWELFVDSCHPSAAAHALLAQQVGPVLLSMLQKR